MSEFLNDSEIFNGYTVKRYNLPFKYTGADPFYFWSGHSIMITGISSSLVHVELKMLYSSSSIFTTDLILWHLL